MTHSGAGGTPPVCVKAGGSAEMKTERSKARSNVFSSGAFPCKLIFLYETNLVHETCLISASLLF